MQKIQVSFMKTGMIIGKTILNSDGQVLLSEGMLVKEQYKEKLMSLGIMEIYIKSPENQNNHTENTEEKENKIKENISKAKEVIKKTMDFIHDGRDFSTKEIYETVEKILDELLNNEGIMLNLSDIRVVDDYTFDHSVNVCVLALVTGISMGYDNEKLKKLGVGAILHDIGKILVPNKILNKPATLTNDEFDQIKKHTLLGFEIIKKYNKIDYESMLVILQHHERFDGSGYPDGKMKSDIHEFARVVAVADVYDALTSDRVYKKRIYPHEAIEYLISMGDHHFDYSIVRKFIRYVASYPKGTIVLLSSGIKGVVLENNPDYPNRPKIRCVTDEQGHKLKEMEELELTKHPYITITKVLGNLV